MQTLFGFEEPKTSLKISAAPKKQLTKAQTNFNQLISRIEKLRKEIPQEVEKYDNLLRCSNEYVLPAWERIARIRIQLVVYLDEVVLTLGYKQKQMEQISIVIADLLDSAFAVVQPSEGEKELYERWAERSLDEADAEREAGQKGMMEDMFEAMFGVKVDLDELKNDPEKLKEFEQQMEEREREEAERMAGKKRGRQTQKGPTKKEALAKAAEELKSKSVRSIYISLAKLVHPDTEPDPILRAAKEEEMKKVSAAYEANDLATLLKMEMEWIHKHNNELDRIPEEKLELFVQVLRDQVKELEGEKAGLQFDPKYSRVAEFAYGRPEIGLQKIKKKATDLQKYGNHVESVRRSLDVPNPKKPIMAFVKEYMEDLAAFEFDFF